MKFSANILGILLLNILLEKVSETDDHTSHTFSHYIIYGWNNGELKWHLFLQSNPEGTWYPILEPLG